MFLMMRRAWRKVGLVCLCGVLTFLTGGCSSGDSDEDARGMVGSPAPGGILTGIDSSPEDLFLFSSLDLVQFLDNGVLKGTTRFVEGRWEPVKVSLLAGLHVFQLDVRTQAALSGPVYLSWETDQIEVVAGQRIRLGPGDFPFKTWTDDDGDGLCNVLEDKNLNGIVEPDESDWLLADTDRDGLSDTNAFEVLDVNCGWDDQQMPSAIFLNTDDDDKPNVVEIDSDEDGLLDGEEDRNGNGLLDVGVDLKETSPVDRDTDDDGLDDGHPSEGFADSNGDGWPNALDPDSDSDGVLDGTEMGLAEPPSSDTDVSGCTDWQYHRRTLEEWADPDAVFCHFRPDAEALDAGANPDAVTKTDPTNRDSDGDGLWDGLHEDLNFNGRVEPGEETDPMALDSDGDGLLDGVEDANRNGVWDWGETDPRRQDTDSDGLSDGDPYEGFQDSDGDGDINALDPDSDNDQILDGTERGVTLARLETLRLDTNLTGCSPENGWPFVSWKETGLKGPFCHFRPDADDASRTDPTNRDTDGDGLLDGGLADQLGVHPHEDKNFDGKVDGGETNPLSVDTDLDGLLDGTEDANRDGVRDSGETDPANDDTDGDGLRDGDPREGYQDTDGDGLINALDTDSDNDGLSDRVERSKTYACRSGARSITESIDSDSDDDGVLDGVEDRDQDGCLDNGEMNPLNPDTDRDGLEDGVEDRNRDGLLDRTLETDPVNADTDGDGLCDGFPLAATGIECVGFEDRNNDGIRGTDETDPLAADTDRDGLCDGVPRFPDRVFCRGFEDADGDGRRSKAETDPRLADTDGDGLCDGAPAAIYGEVVYEELDCVLYEDADNDGTVEAGVETDPRMVDTDGGRRSDYEELLIYNTDPVIGSDDLQVLYVFPPVVERGDTLQIVGTGFSRNPGENLVRFKTDTGTVAVLPSASTNRLLKVGVPADAVSGRFSITAPSEIAEGREITDLSNKAVSVSNSLIKEIPLEDSVTPGGMVFSPGGDLAYVADTAPGTGESDMIFTVDAENGALTEDPPIVLSDTEPRSIQDLAMSRDGTFLVAVTQSNPSLTVVDLESGVPNAFDMTGFKPRAVALAGTGDDVRAYMLSNDTHEVVVVDPQNGTVETLIDLKPAPTDAPAPRDIAIAQNPGGVSHAYVLNYWSGTGTDATVTRINLDTFDLKADALGLSAGLKPQSIAVNTDGSRYYVVATTDDGVSEFVIGEVDWDAVDPLFPDIPPDAATRLITFEEAFNLKDIALSKDGSVAYVAASKEPVPNLERGAFLIMDLTPGSEQVSQEIRVGESLDFVAVNADETRAYAVDKGDGGINPGLAVVDVSTGPVIREIPAGRNPVHLVLEDPGTDDLGDPIPPERAFVATTGPGERRILELNLRTGTVEDVLYQDPGNFAPRYLAMRYREPETPTLVGAWFNSAANPDVGLVSEIDPQKDPVTISPLYITDTTHVVSQWLSVAVHPEGFRAYTTIQFSASDPSETLAVIPLGVEAPPVSYLDVGDFPTHMVIAPVPDDLNRYRGYVTNLANDSIVVVNLAGGEEDSDEVLTSTIDLGVTPWAVGVTGDGTRAVVANILDQSASIIKLESEDDLPWSDVETITVGSRPYSVAVAPDGTRAYVADSVDDELYVVDLVDQTDYKVLGTIPSGAGTWFVTLRPDGSRAYAVNFTGNTITVILTDPWLPDLPDNTGE